MLVYAAEVSVIPNLSICPLSVGPRGVIFVSEEGLQLSDAAAHSGNLQPDNKDICCWTNICLMDESWGNNTFKKKCVHKVFFSWVLLSSFNCPEQGDTGT